MQCCCLIHPSLRSGCLPKVLFNHCFCLQSDRTAPYQQQPRSQQPHSEPSEHFHGAATDHAQLSARSDAWVDAVSAPSASQVLTMAAAAGTDWKARADVFAAMQQLFQPDAQTPLDLASCSEKLVQLLLEHIGETRFPCT